MIVHPPSPPQLTLQLTIPSSPSRLHSSPQVGAHDSELMEQLQEARDQLHETIKDHQEHLRWRFSEEQALVKECEGWRTTAEHQ